MCVLAFSNFSQIRRKTLRLTIDLTHKNARSSMNFFYQIASQFPMLVSSSRMNEFPDYPESIVVSALCARWNNFACKTNFGLALIERFLVSLCSSIVFVQFVLEIRCRLKLNKLVVHVRGEMELINSRGKMAFWSLTADVKIPFWCLSAFATYVHIYC